MLSSSSLVKKSSITRHIGAPSDCQVDTRLLQELQFLPDRNALGDLAQRLGFTTGAELGVLRGELSKTFLDRWPSNVKYYMIDLWAHQDNYVDVNNHQDSAHNENYGVAMELNAAHKDKLEVLRMYTTEAAVHIPDESLDFIYVDARHDYCGVTEDLETYWPKLKAGGIFAGHDYYTYAEQNATDPGQNWSVCGNGTIHAGSVRGAVDEFAAQHNLPVLKTGEHAWYSWATRKPLCKYS